MHQAGKSRLIAHHVATMKREKEGNMTESTKVIASLKKASNYTKLAMHAKGPRSFKRGQGALIKVIQKFGNGSMCKDEAKKVLGWHGCDVRAVAKIAADNGYLKIEDPKNGFQMTLTDLGKEIVAKRLEAEDKAADSILSALTDKEKAQLETLCDKISKTAEDMGIDYAKIQKRKGERCGKRCGRKHGKGHGDQKCMKHGGKGHGKHDAKYVFVFKD